MLTFNGIHESILSDTTPELAVIGGRGSGKSTVCVTKEIRYSKNFPGIKEFLFRVSEKDTESKLIPFFKEMCDHEKEYPAWNNSESAFVFGNGSITFMFGIRTTSAAQRYAKIRGLGVARLYGDQMEESGSDLGLELRASLRQPNFPKQLTYGANPPSDFHWLAKQFPIGVEHRFKNRRLYQLSIYDNKFLPAETLRELEQAYPPSHPNYKTLLLGQYGVSVIGEPIYGEMFRRDLHVRPIAYKPELQLVEAFDFGQLNPCWIIGQRPRGGGMHWLGGVIGQEMYLVDFIPIVQEYRSRWFPNADTTQIRTACTLSQSRKLGNLVMGVEELRAADFHPAWKEGSNSPDVVLALIERQASYMRRRGGDGAEMFGINNAEDRWWKADREGMSHSPFMSYAYEGGYSWSQTMDGKPVTVSVGRNEFRQPHPDSWYEFPMRCAEAIELNFSVKRPTEAERFAAEQQARRGPTSDAPQRSPHSWLRS